MQLAINPNTRNTVVLSEAKLDAINACKKRPALPNLSRDATAKRLRNFGQQYNQSRTRNVVAAKTPPQVVPRLNNVHDV